MENGLLHLGLITCANSYCCGVCGIFSCIYEFVSVCVHVRVCVCVY